MLPAGALERGVLARPVTPTAWRSTVEMRSRADVVRSSFHRSLVRSDERLDYDRVDRIFAGQERAAEPWAASAEAAARRRARAALGLARASRALALNSTEPDFASTPRATSPTSRPSRRPSRTGLIEHLMVAANEQVAALLEDASCRRSTRVHERPEPDAVLTPRRPARVARRRCPRCGADRAGRDGRRVAAGPVPGGRDWTEQRGEGRRAPHLPRAALAQAGVLLGTAATRGNHAQWSSASLTLATIAY
jgi:hypothetical protein